MTDLFGNINWYIIDSWKYTDLLVLLQCEGQLQLAHQHKPGKSLYEPLPVLRKLEIFNNSIMKTALKMQRVCVRC